MSNCLKDHKSRIKLGSFIDVIYTSFFYSFLHSFIPEFLKRIFPLLHLDKSTDANRGFSQKKKKKKKKKNKKKKKSRKV